MSADFVRQRMAELEAENKMMEQKETYLQQTIQECNASLQSVVRARLHIAGKHEAFKELLPKPVPISAAPVDAKTPEAENK